MSKLYMKMSNGQPSASLTMALVSFTIVTGWLLFWVIGSTFGLRVPEFDSVSAMGYMTPLLGLYFGRRWTDKGVISQDSQEESQVEETNEDSSTTKQQEEGSNRT